LGARGCAGTGEFADWAIRTTELMLVAIFNYFYHIYSCKLFLK
jgi:hypothetical protein